MAEAQQHVGQAPQAVDNLQSSSIAAADTVTREPQMDALKRSEESADDNKTEVQSEETPPAEAPPKEEKIVETVQGSEELHGRERQWAADAAADLRSFKEETYRVADLKESEKKALQEFKLKVEDAIKCNAFMKQPPKQGTRDIELVKASDESEKKTENAGKAEADERTESETKQEVEIKPAKDEAPGNEAAGVTKTPAASAEEPVTADGGVFTAVPVGEQAKEAYPTVVTTVEPAVVVTEEVSERPEEEGAALVPVEPTTEPAVSQASTPTLEESMIAKEEVLAPIMATDETAELQTQATAVTEVTVQQASRDVVIEEKETTPPEYLSLWGVPLLQSEGDERTDVILLKFLRARDYKVNDAFSMLQNAVFWRKEFHADKLLEEDFGTEFDSVAYMHGCDREGHPVCYNHYGLFQNKEFYHQLFENESKFHYFLRWRIQVLEKGIQKLDFAPGGVCSMVQITDLKDSPGFMKRRNITKRALAVLQDNYPELVAKQVFINAPWYFSALYSVYGRIITQRQKSKVVVASPGKVTETLFKYISPEQVPVKYGGLSRPNDVNFGGIDAPLKEFVVKAGEKQVIDIPVTESGSTVVWDLAVAGWEVVYGEEFVPSAEGGYTVIIQKPKKVSVSEEPVRNSFKVSEPGKIMLRIDNSTSRRKRLVVHRYVTKPAPEC